MKKRIEHLLKVIILIFRNKETGIVSKQYNIRKCSDCYVTIINVYVEQGTKTDPWGIHEHAT